MRVLISGKGGVGKTTIAAGLARLAGRDGLRVMAVDYDTEPNLGLSLGLSPEAAQTAERRARSFEHPTLTTIDKLEAEHLVPIAERVGLLIASQADDDSG